MQCSDSLPKGALRSSRVRMRTVRVFSLSYSTDLLPGYGRGLSHSPDITSHVHNQSPNILLPTGRVERKLILGPNVGFHTLVAQRWSWGFGETQASVFAQRALPGRGKVASGTRRGLLDPGQLLPCRHRGPRSSPRGPLEVTRNAARQRLTSVSGKFNCE